MNLSNEPLRYSQIPENGEIDVTMSIELQEWAGISDSDSDFHDDQDSNDVSIRDYLVQKLFDDSIPIDDFCYSVVGGTGGYVYLRVTGFIDRGCLFVPPGGDVTVEATFTTPDLYYRNKQEIPKSSPPSRELQERVGHQVFDHFLVSRKSTVYVFNVQSQYVGESLLSKLSREEGFQTGTSRNQDEIKEVRHKNGSIETIWSRPKPVNIVAWGWWDEGVYHRENGPAIELGTTTEEHHEPAETNP